MGLLSKNDIGVKKSSDWTQFTQDEIDNFGRDTRDVAALHMDPAWAEKNSPFKSTIANGFQTLSLLTWLNHQIFGKSPDGEGSDGYAINYGFERVRFTGPVPVNQKFRGHMTLTKLEERKLGQQLQTFSVEIELEDQNRRVVVAEWLGLWVTQEGHEPLLHGA